MQVTVIPALMRTISNPVVKEIDRRVSIKGNYDKIDLQPFVDGLLCWQRYRALREMQKGLTSGTIEYWSWMPGGGRAGIAAHVIWKVGPFPLCLTFAHLDLLFSKSIAPVMCIQVPRIEADRDPQMTARIQASLVARQTVYYNRAARSAMLAVTQPLYISASSAMVACLEFFTGEYMTKARFPRDRTVERQTPQIAAELAVLSQDLDLGMDLRRLNARPEDPAFDKFWAKACHLLEEYKRVDDRRHGESLPPLLHCIIYYPCVLTVQVMTPPPPPLGVSVDSSTGSLFMPFAMSTRDLRDRVVEALETEHPEGLEAAGIKVPTLAWVEFQFAPANEGFKAALKYTGMPPPAPSPHPNFFSLAPHVVHVHCHMLNFGVLAGKLAVKHKVQLRTLRQTHVDSHYCGALFKYAKELCLKLAKAVHQTNPTMVVRFVSQDDKAKVCTRGCLKGGSSCMILPSNSLGN